MQTVNLSSLCICVLKMLLLKNGEAYDQIMFDQSAAIQVESDGAADFGLKFLSLSKDGLLPQYPMRVTLSRDKDARDVVVSTASLRVILYKMCVRQAAEDITSPFPKFELSVIDMFNNKIDIYGKVELHLYSTASPPHMPINRMEWLREPLSWSYERGPRGSDQSQLPALISIKTSAIMTGKSAFRLRATMLGINSTAFSLTKIGRGFSAPFNLTGDSRQLATKPQYMPSVYQSTGQNAGIVRLTALESLPPSGSADTAVPKTPQDIFRQFAQVVMRSLHNAYMSTSGDGFNADALNDAYEM